MKDVVLERNGLERIEMNDMAPQRRGRNQPSRRWTQEFEGTMGMRVQEAKGLTPCHLPPAT